MRLSPVLVDVVSVLVVGVLAGLGKLSAELASGTILAILAGRMKPVNGGDPAAPTTDQGSSSSPAAPRRTDSIHFEGEAPSGLLTILTAPLLALKSAASHP